MDYSEVDIHNPMWWKQWRFLVRTMSDLEYGDLIHKAYEFQLALVSNNRISAEDFSAVQREAKELFKDIEGHLRPWLGRTKEDRKVQETQEFKEQWEAVAGFYPDDKEALRAWEKEIKQHTDATQERRVEAEREELNRQSTFHAKIEAVRKKRLKQQGRK